MGATSKSEAISLGVNSYFTGRPCIHGHVAKRWVKSGCSECCSLRGKEWRKNNLDKVKINNKISSKTYKDHLKKTAPWKYMLRTCKQRSKLKGLDFNLDWDWAKDRWTGRCELSNIEFIISSNQGPTPFGPSVDRIDNSKGYTKDNCRFILLALNSMKGQGTDQDMFIIAEALINHGK